MISLRALFNSSITVGLILLSLAVSPRSSGQAADLQKKVEAQYAITKTTDDKSDIVNAGAILILQKDKLLMYATSNAVPPQNTYKDGKLSAGAYAAHEKMQRFGSMIGHPPPQTVQTRYFVTGEKFWVTHIDYPADGIVFTLFTDAISDVRYYSTLKFVYPHGIVLTSDQVLTLVAEVLKVQQDDNANSGGDANQQNQQGQQNQQAAPADNQQQAAPAADSAPAQPAAPPATVEIGQTVDQVTAILGQPDKIINLGPKQIYVYKDLKVTFVKGKVTDAQ